ncbi:MAG: hypothetical protein M0P10_06920, partial [Sphaerochaetaceae bacterium]|nr:hypothetical protein [Sphaerochaetaceae bacterium]
MELFKLFGTIMVDSSSSVKTLKEFDKKVNVTQGSSQAAFNKIGAFATAAGKTMAKGLAIGSAALGALTVKALSAT